MHILLANQWFPPESGWGGVAMWNYAMARAYRALGHQVTVVASRTSSQIAAFLETDGVSVHRLLVHDMYRFRRLPGIRRYVRPAQQLAYAWRVDRVLRRLHLDQSYDIVEFADVNAEGFFYTWHPLTPVVVRCHTPTFVLKRYYNQSEMSYDTRIVGWCERDMIRRAHALTAPSRDMAQVIANATNVSLDKIAVIPNALPHDQFSAETNSTANGTSSRVTILYVGRLERAKGVNVLGEAIPQVIAEFPNAHFVFVGDAVSSNDGKGQWAGLGDYLRRTNASSHIEFVNNADHKTLIEHYKAADICVVPSLLYESFSYTCAQAMAMGKPVVASRIGGIPETVEDGATGLLVPPGDAPALANGILRLVKDPAMRIEMGKSGKAKAATGFDSSRVAEDTIAVFERAIAQHKLQT